MFALGVLLLTLPLLALLAVAILIESGRPVLFRQLRAGYRKRPFWIYKFRTLRPGPHDPLNPDTYATRVGWMLRRYGLDELPQLWNVVRGEMSLVGPRPTVLDQAARYDAFEQRRLHVKPGLTGWAQIHGRTRLPWPERITLDVWYIDHRSMRLDLYILARTALMLFIGSAAPSAPLQTAYRHKASLATRPIHPRKAA